MKYRREVDGLRSIAVIPVILFHAGFQKFSGGFVGVDVFFVISGYLITTIISGEIANGTFSLLSFYERRARRILPALYLVMLCSSVFAYLWMMPDELKNFGQSLVATVFFSNNILLALTSGYWELASEYKPLLHTWSLGVEEQYYIFFPLILMVGAISFHKWMKFIVFAIFVGSLTLASFQIYTAPTFAFYLLTTRAWELLLGSLIALFLENERVKGVLSSLSARIVGVLALLGLAMILSAVFYFDRDERSPGPFLLIPTIGAGLVIVFARPNNFIGKLLGSRLLVGIGLISYSVYLWHQPLISFARVYFVYEPGSVFMSVLVALTFILAFFTWKYVEAPFRSRELLSRNKIFGIAAIFGVCIAGFGFILNKTYGLHQLVFPSYVKIGEIDKRIYNERVFNYKKNGFVAPKKIHVLVVGNSVARDFVNMNIETFNLDNVEIIYRDDLRDCIFPFKSELSRELFESADVIVFASDITAACVHRDIAFAEGRGAKIYYVGPKHFGNNLNWIKRLPENAQHPQFNKIPEQVVLTDERLQSAVPYANFLPQISKLGGNGMIPITDQRGIPLSTDRVHLTRYGAIYLGQRVLADSYYSEALRNPPLR